ncbi:hypothetical protein HOI26_03080 [Candidatus Woesearchaeota archaeon]|jgi:hypothetical protein|nr:hypothetical protein [Candidatus Woesearchaeota archaeon]
MIEILNLLSAISAIASTVYLFIVANKCAKGLHTSAVLLATGVLVSVALHSLAEFLEAYGFLSENILFNVMPILVLIGSIILLIGTYYFFRVIKGVNN